MDIYRLKTKIGPHEFEAEGDREDVKAQYSDFLKAVAMAATQPATDVVIPPGTVSLVGQELRAMIGSVQPSVQPTVDAALNKIMKLDARVVSLTVRASSVDDATLLLIYGHKMLREAESVSGYEVMQGLTVSGSKIARVDRVLDKAGRDGYVIVVGQHRGRRYRLTNTGLARARELAAALIETVA